MLINSAGDQEELACFQRDSNTDAYRSCSINWNNQLFIFGGETERRQISRLTGHKLERIGDLTFDHDFAACSVMSSQYIFLCFNLADSNDHKRCRRSTGPLDQFSEVALSTYNHGYSQTSSSDSKL